MSTSLSVGCLGVLPPAWVPAAVGLVLGLVACGGSADAPEAAQPSAQGTTLLYRGDDDLSNGDAASVVNVWQFDERRMSRGFVHDHDPGRGLTGTVTLLYSVVDSADRSIQLEWPYDGRAVTYHYDDLQVAPSYVVFGDHRAEREWHAVAGEVAIEPLPNGQVLVNLNGLEIGEYANDEGRVEPLADGYVLGDVERLCIEYVDLADGDPPQPRRDEDWSSPYCAQFVQ